MKVIKMDDWNILHVTKTYFPESFGGIEEVIRQISNGTAPLGFRSTVFTFTQQAYKDVQPFEDHHVFRCQRALELASTPFSLSAIAKFRALAKEADLIHFHYPFPYGDILLLLSGTNTPAIATYHSDIVRQKRLRFIYKPIETYFLKQMKKIIATSENYVETSQNLKRFKDKTIVIPLGISPDTPKGKFHKTRWPETFKPKTPFILYLGNMREYKGLDYLVEAAKSFNGQIVLAGSGRQRDRLLERCHLENIKNCHFLGAVTEEEKSFLLTKARALVLPSHQRSEAFGAVLLEAAKYKLPQISTALGTGTDFANLDGVSGMVISPRNVSELTKAMTILIENETLAKQFGTNARERFEQLFTAEIMCNAYAKIYKSCIKH